VARLLESFFFAPHRENPGSLGRHRATGSRARREPAGTARFEALNNFLLQRKAADPITSLTFAGRHQADWVR
jgi:hypothetical protein